jgi:phosphatidylserine/phosphatidylglycerophosphate/cardiolipin synthase-like enzyme
MSAKALPSSHVMVRRVLKARGSPKAHANCKRKPYKPIKVPEFSNKGTIIAFASPDSTFAVTRERFKLAKTSIQIGIYDFTAEYIRDELIDAMQRGVKVELLLDLEGAVEQRIFDDLGTLGAGVLRAPSCANAKAPFFSVVHQKVIVIDARWSLVQSGNYTAGSIPINEPDKGWPDFKTGNRDTGVAIDSKPIAAFFSKRLAGDRKLVIDAKMAPKAIAMLKAMAKAGGLLVPKPKIEPKQKFKARTFTFPTAIKLQPLLTPDNYLIDVPPLLEAARKSIHIEQQYIWSWQPKVQLLIAAMKRALDKAPDLEIRIVLGKAFAATDVPKFDHALDKLKEDLGIVRGKNVRFINQEMFVHCHNKLILIDGKVAITSSQNWSDTAVDTNREAGVALHHAGICNYFEQIFDHDWTHGVLQPLKQKPKFFAPKSFSSGQLVRLDAGDIAFV